MIEFGKITGDMEGHYIEVQMRTGEHLYAPIVVSGNSVSIPSKSWIEANKENFLALIAFEKDILENPMVIGFYPVKGAESKTYDVTEKLLAIVAQLVDELQKARVNTQLGPQKFLPDTQIELSNMKDTLTEISKTINSLKL